MKIVKLNRNHTAFSEGYTHALRFSEYTESRPYVEILDRAYGTYPYSRLSRRYAPVWYADFGSRDKKTGMKAYWINLRNEADLTMVLLAKGK
jgi:hypothetical protein